MTYKTWSEIKAKIKRQLDLTEQDFTSDTELLEYANEAIDTVEAEIHNMYEDYFLAKAYIPLISGTIEYDLPSDIYANKIRRIQYYRSDTDHYEIIPIKVHEIAEVDINEYYRYIIINDGTNGFKIELHPASRETSSANVIIYYLRNAKRLTADSDECDIPEFSNVIIDYIRMKVLEKDGSPLLEKAISDYAMQIDLMKRTLSNRAPDRNNLITPDMDIYEEME